MKAIISTLLLIILMNCVPVSEGEINHAFYARKSFYLKKSHEETELISIDKFKKIENKYTFIQKKIPSFDLVGKPYSAALEEFISEGTNWSFHPIARRNQEGFVPNEGLRTRKGKIASIENNILHLFDIEIVDFVIIETTNEIITLESKKILFIKLNKSSYIVNSKGIFDFLKSEEKENMFLVRIADELPPDS